MKIKTISLIASLVFLIPNFLVAKPEWHILVDAYNHLTVNYIFLREGMPPTAIKKDIINNVNFASLPSELIELYRSFLKLTDQVSSKRELLKQQAKNINQQQEKANEAHSEKITSDILSGVIASGSTGNPLGLISSLFSLLNTQTSYNETDTNLYNNIKHKIQNSLREELTDFEFNLSLKKSQLTQKYEIERRQYIKPEDVDNYVAIKKNSNINKNILSECRALFEKSPRMYFLGIELAAYEFNKKDRESGERYLKKTLESIPSFLNRSPIRTRAQALLGALAVDKSEIQNGYKWFNKALKEDPSNQIALTGKANLLLREGNVSDSLVLYKKIVRLYPTDAISRYNYSCILSRTNMPPEKVLSELKEAFKYGFTNIAHAKNDPDFGLMRQSKEFKDLTNFKFSYDIKWRNLHKDELIITNTSAFDWTKVGVEIAFALNDGRGFFRPNEKPVLNFTKLQRNDTLKIPFVFSTQFDLTMVKVSLSAEQGNVYFEIHNRNGRLTVKNFHMKE